MYNHVYTVYDIGYLDVLLLVSAKLLFFDVKQLCSKTVVQL